MKPDYQRIAASTASDRRDLFVSTARRIGVAEQNIEKDFWVCWALEALFHGRPASAPRLLFKGGTSLSKAFNLIQRFSEDIDITVYREDLGQSVALTELEVLSGKKRQLKLDHIRAACQQYLTRSLCPDLITHLTESHITAAGAAVLMDELDPDQQTILLRYPTVFPQDPYVRPAVRIECGAKSALDPSTPVTLLPYVAEDLPNLDLAVEGVTTIIAERTFWDKVVIVHGLRSWFDNRGELRQQGQRVSRHYYDLHQILPTPIGARALANPALGHECVRHAAVFFGRPDFDLGSAAAGDFKLVPSDTMIDGLRRDYTAMTGMIYGPVPAFEDVMASIATLEARLRDRSKG